MNESILGGLWRRAVISEYGERCIVCGSTFNLEAHHVGGRCELLKYDWRSGVMVCGNFSNKQCHRFVEIKEGRDFLEQKIGEERWNYIQEMKRKDFRQYLVENGLTREEFLTIKHCELLRKI